jgi:glyoxylase-like metal-dependent hydrolase (beta-lactamase superfamily II)
MFILLFFIYLYCISTLFIGGVGKFFEGDARDMYRILFHVLTKLPEETWVYCGHEYTKNNLKVRRSYFNFYKQILIVFFYL